jgi:3',5'-cyclic AMP phosphodiesterase CpdA
MQWAGTGLLFSMAGGVAFTEPPDTAATLSFVQISDSHMGFNKPANEDVAGTFKVAIDKINAMPGDPAFLIHTGDISHLSKPEQFDQVEQMLKSSKVKQHYFVPGEHDVLENGGKAYLERFGGGASGGGWYSFDSQGVHFVALVNVIGTKAGGLGYLGADQLAWLEKDLRDRTASTPIVVFAHVPLWTVYQDWGWGTDDGAQALLYLRRFGSVTVLNGHIHQNIQKVEGNMFFHTACSTAFPQPKPGAAPSPGPMKTPADQLRGFLGLTEVRYVAGASPLALMDSNLM